MDFYMKEKKLKSIINWNCKNSFSFRETICCLPKKVEEKGCITIPIEDFFGVFPQKSKNQSGRKWLAICTWRK